MTTASRMVSIWIIAAAATCFLVASSSLQSDSQQPARSPLFDFKPYQVLFNKHYQSHLEEATRQIYFYANALAVYATALAYKLRRSGHYLALNEMSDWSRQELDLMTNKVLVGRGEPKSQIKNALDDGLSGRPQRRAKRDLSGQETRLRPRRISMDMLVQGVGPVSEPAQVVAKIERRPVTNNPTYDELAMELDTRGLVDQQENIEHHDWHWALEPHSRIVHSSNTNAQAAEPRSSLESVKSLIGQLARSLFDSANDEDFETGEVVFEQQVQLADEMFVDLRESGCLWRARAQGKCGSCYAFGAISMAEFMFCNKTGHLYAFSEQYLIDCGLGTVDQMLGCDGATTEASAKFVHNFGLELLDRYPYLEREGQCPYSNETDLRTTGYIRMELARLLYVPVEAWPDVLGRTPILTAIATPPLFESYGGGVDSGKKCGQEADHVVLVVGHGREDGQEFWLMRNSYGTRWGDRGYYKLAKSAPKGCIELDEGVVWATNNGDDFHIEPKLNGANHRVNLELATLKRD